MKLEATAQVKREILNAYAMSAPGTTLPALLKSLKVTPNRFQRWKREDPRFAQEVVAIQEERARINFDNFERYMNAIDHTLVMKAINGDVAAIRLVKELVGQVKSGAQVRVEQNVGVNNGNRVHVGSPEELRKLIERRNELSELARRNVQSIDVDASSAGDSGSTSDSGAASTQS